MNPNLVQAPFNQQQIKALQEYQRYPMVHPYTCPSGCGTILTPQENGLACTFCGHLQTWALQFTTKGITND